MRAAAIVIAASALCLLGTAAQAEQVVWDQGFTTTSDGLFAGAAGGNFLGLRWLEESQAKAIDFVTTQSYSINRVTFWVTNAVDPPPIRAKVTFTENSSSTGYDLPANSGISGAAQPVGWNPWGAEEQIAAQFPWHGVRADPNTYSGGSPSGWITSDVVQGANVVCTDTGELNGIAKIYKVETTLAAPFVTTPGVHYWVSVDYSCQRFMTDPNCSTTGYGVMARHRPTDPNGPTDGLLSDGVESWNGQRMWSGNYDFYATLEGVPALVGDTDGNGVVDVNDLNNVFNNLGTANPLGDTDSNGVVDVNDLNNVFNNLGTVGASVGAVPEPLTISLLALGGLAALRRRR